VGGVVLRVKLNSFAEMGLALAALATGFGEFTYRVKVHPNNIPDDLTHKQHRLHQHDSTL
jgi:hypothetical protein